MSHQVKQNILKHEKDFVKIRDAVQETVVTQQEAISQTKRPPSMMTPDLLSIEEEKNSYNHSTKTRCWMDNG